MRAFARLVFSLSVLGSTLAWTGLVVAPHAEAPGTPRHHDHVLAAYRFALFELRLADRFDPSRAAGPRFAATAPIEDVAAALVLAILALGAPRLARPARSALATPASARLAAAVWSPALAPGPPRRCTLRAFAA
ncbi:MAG TPA: hypothetical protein VFM93_03450 [Candidatus Limnocylindria bacterium]|nr:hypothetical protein [Candidatus Limnocylindria bacterium]